MVIDHDINDGGLGPAEPIASPNATVLLALPPIAGIDTDLLVAARRMQGGIRLERGVIKQGFVALAGLTQRNQRASLIRHGRVRGAKSGICCEHFSRSSQKVFGWTHCGRKAYGSAAIISAVKPGGNFTLRATASQSTLNAS